jgi:hypothetical protein
MGQKVFEKKRRFQPIQVINADVDNSKVKKYRERLSDVNIETASRASKPPA